jgi:hypothetical protein
MTVEEQDKHAEWLELSRRDTVMTEYSTIVFQLEPAEMRSYSFLGSPLASSPRSILFSTVVVLLIS